MHNDKFLIEISKIHYCLMDCYDLVARCYKHYKNINLPPVDNRKGNANLIHSEYQKKINSLWKPLKEPTPYSLVMLTFDGIYTSHCGFMLDCENFIHIYQNIGFARIDNINNYKHLIRGFYDFIAK